MKIFVWITLFVTFAINLHAATITLSGGDVEYTHRDIGGKYNVVLLHSGTLPSWTMSSYERPLNKLDFNTLKFDFYGMGKSDAPRGLVSHDRNVFEQQLLELLLRIGWVAPNAKPLYILGVGSGAAIGAHFMMRNPGTVEKLFAVSPGYHVKSTKSWTSKMMIGVMSWLPNNQFFRRRVKKTVKKSVLELFDKLSPFKKKIATKKFEMELNDPKYIDSMYRRMIGDFFKSYSQEFRRLAILNTPVKIVAGALDKNVPSHHLLEIQQFYNQPRLIEIEVISNAGAELSATSGKDLAGKAGAFFLK